MSYNINTIDYLSGELFMTDEKRGAARDIPSSSRPPEGCFLDTYNDKDCWHNDMITALWWYGEGSGYSYDLLKEVLALTTGCADLMIVWEGGDDITGLRVLDGDVIEYSVTHTLGEAK